MFLRRPADASPALHAGHRVRRLRTLLFRSAYNLPVTAGLVRGLFARHGLDLEVAYTRGSKMTAEALRTGACDVAVFSADDTAYVVETRGDDVFMFMGLHAGILALYARPGIARFEDLRGGRLGVDDSMSGFGLIAQKLMRQHGLASSDYATVEAGGHADRARAFLEGAFDVTLLTPPFSFMAEARGFTCLARVCEHLPRYQASAGTTTRRWAAAHGDDLVAYIRAYLDGLRWVFDPANRDAAIAELARDFDLFPALAARTYDALIDRADGLFPDARLDVEGVKVALDLRVEAGLMASPPPDPSKYYDSSYFARATAHREGGFHANA